MIRLRDYQMEYPVNEIYIQGNNFKTRRFQHRTLTATFTVELDEPLPNTDILKFIALEHLAGMGITEEEIKAAFPEKFV